MNGPFLPSDSGGIIRRPSLARDCGYYFSGRGRERDCRTSTHGLSPMVLLIHILHSIWTLMRMSAQYSLLETSVVESPGMIVGPVFSA